MDWSAIYMRNVFDSGPFLAGFAVAAFAFSQATTRFFADSFVDRHSPTTVARFLLCVMAVGRAPGLLLAGARRVAPRLRAARRRRPARSSRSRSRRRRSAPTAPAAINVAALAQISFIIFLLGPAARSASSPQHWGRWAFGLGPSAWHSASPRRRRLESLRRERRSALAGGRPAQRLRVRLDGVAGRVGTTATTRAHRALPALGAEARTSEIDTSPQPSTSGVAPALGGGDELAVDRGQARSPWIVASKARRRL